MRNLVSTVIVALTVGALAGASMGAIAQSEPTGDEPALAPAAGINADRVDGRHAVGAGTTKVRRANKLVATNRNGMLPSNIVKHSWGLIRGKPAGFADGTDDVGVASITVTRLQSDAVSVGANSFASGTVDCPSGKVVGGGFSAPLGTVSSGVVAYQSLPWDADTWWVAVRNPTASASYFFVWATCMTTDPPAAIAAQSKGVKPVSLKHG